MAYDRYDSRDEQRGNGDRQNQHRGSGERDERGFFDRARDEVTSWFGDEDAGRRRQQDDRSGHPASSRGQESRSDMSRRGYEDRYTGSSRFEPQSYDREDDRFGHSDRGAFFGGGQSTSYGRGRDGGDYRNQYGRGGGESGGFGRGDYGHQEEPSFSRQGSRGSYPSGYGQTGGGSYRESQHQSHGHDRHPDEDRQSRGYQSQGSERTRPLTGDYGRSGSSPGRSGSGMGSQEFGRDQYGRQDFSQDQDSDRRYNYGGWGDRDSQRQQGSGFMGAGTATGTSAFGSGRSAHDEHYSSWRQRQIEELDRDYDEYRREHQSRFENEFSGFRQQRQTKRQMLQSIREHFEVVDESGQHIGTVDKVRGDKVILTKNDPEAGGVHRSFTCTLLERVEGNRVTLSGSKDSIRSRLQVEDDGDRSQQQRSGGGILGGLFGGGSDREQDHSAMSQQPHAGGSATPSQQQGTQEGDGPHMLDRSFSGTYDDENKSK